MRVNSYFVATSLLFLVLHTDNANSATSQYGSTIEKQSPVQNCNSQSKCTVIYSKERIGKKLAIRSIYLIPTYDISRKFCESPSTNCKDTYEAAFIYLELQSIWPEPFLLTAARVSVKTRSKAVHTDPAMYGKSVLATHITANSSPDQFLFKPGEIKLVGLSQGIKLEGILNFFNGDVLNDDIWTYRTPISIPYIGRVAKFNHFLQKTYGKTTAIDIRLFEKDYQLVLKTDVKLGEGSDLFAQGNIPTSRYQFKHDAFIGEVLYQLKGGTVAFEQRLNNNIRQTDGNDTEQQPNALIEE